MFKTAKRLVFACWALQVVTLTAPLAPPALGEKPANVEGVKRLYDFEVREYLAGATKRSPRYVGKPVQSRGVPSGWRFKDHPELKLTPDYDGPVTIYADVGSRDRPIARLYKTGATHGKYAMCYAGPIPGWRMAKLAAAGDPRGAGGQGSAPHVGSYHSRAEHFWQRECNIIDDALAHSRDRRDWSAYDRLRIDVYAKGNPAVLGLLVQDSSGLATKYGRMGLRTALAEFRVPRDRQVTIDFPLADMARVGELDLAKAMGFVLQLHGFQGEAEIFIDNIRLLTKAAAKADAKYPLIAMEGPVRPFARKVIYRPTPRFPEKLKRRTGPVTKLGPVDITLAPYGSYTGGAGHFGGSGSVYFQSLRRACVAYDNDRLCVVFGGAVKKGRRIVGGIFATASFDGGKTWGGLKPGHKEPVLLKTWHGRATGSSDATGDIYLVGTENCASYHVGYDTFFRRLAFTGEGWEDDRVSIVAQNMRKCPGTCRAWRLRSGRIWLTWCHGAAGPNSTLAKYSDDDGYTWAPCKDASITQLPRPFYKPDLADLKKPPGQRKPPASVLLWPSTPVPGAVLLPYRDGIAVIGWKQWQVHDGTTWGPRRDLPLAGAGSATVLGPTHIFIAVGGRYSNRLRNERRGALVVADYQDGKWNKRILETSDVGDTILTASGEAVFCFYVKAVSEGGREIANEVRYRRWKAGKWGESVLVARESFRINRLAAPIVCPPDYAAVWWDQRKQGGTAGRTKASALRFARVPNP